MPATWQGLPLYTLCIYPCVPTTHEYGTRPFLRWARSQGRNPHASGKAKNTFGPVGIPLFGAPQAPGNKPNPTPRRGYKPGGMAPWGRRKSPVPRHTRQNRPEVRRPTECKTQELERKGHNHPKKERGPLYTLVFQEFILSHFDFQRQESHSLSLSLSLSLSVSLSLSLSLFISTSRNSLTLPQLNTRNMGAYTFCDLFLSCSAFSVRLVPVSNTASEISSNPERDKQPTWEKSRSS